MKIAFDPAKDITSRAKHGMSLADGELIFGDPDHLIIPSIRRIDGEERYKILGLIDGRLHTAIFVGRGNSVRFISVRRSNDGEARAYSS